jgi:hypothetical protein
MNKWEKGPVKLANGDEALIDAINERQEGNRYTGRARNHAGDWVACGWHADGRYMYGQKHHPCNLAPPPKKTVRVQAWLLVSPNGYIAPLYDESEAIANAKKHGFALIEIDREVMEGEGL